jgi:hypothetical protein
MLCLDLPCNLAVTQALINYRSLKRCRVDPDLSDVHSIVAVRSVVPHWHQVRIPAAMGVMMGQCKREGGRGGGQVSLGCNMTTASSLKRRPVSQMKLCHEHHDVEVTYCCSVTAEGSGVAR